jgi:hypothetical protein
LHLVDPPDPPEQRPPWGGQLDELLAVVGRVRPAADQPGDFEPVEHDGDVREGDVQIAGKFPL